MKGLIELNKNKKDFAFSLCNSTLIQKKSSSRTHYYCSENLSHILDKKEINNIYISVEKISTHHIWLNEKLKMILNNSACSIVKNPNRAKYILSANVANFGITNSENIQNILVGGFCSFNAPNRNELKTRLNETNLCSFLLSDIQLKEWIGNERGINLIKQNNEKTFQSRLIIFSEIIEGII